MIDGGGEGISGTVWLDIGEEFKKYDAEGIQVRDGFWGMTEGLFGGGVSRGADREGFRPDSG